MSLRIALLTYSTKPRGGVVHTLALAEALAAAGHQVTVWTLGRGGDGGFFRAVDRRVTLEVVPFAAREDESVGDRIVRSIAVLRAAFRPGDYDIVHAEDCISANAVDGCIRTVHHIDHFTTPELMRCHHRAIAEPRSLICVSRSVADEVVVGWGRHPVVIPNGVDSGRFEAAAADGGEARRRREVWRSRFGPYILAVGGIEPRKGTLDLIDAYSILMAEGVGVRLVIAGGETLFDYSDYRAEFDRRIARRGLAVDVLGTIADDELPSLVAGASAHSFVSTKEGFGLSAMEALAAGVPVVARDLEVLHEVFSDTVAFAAEPQGMASALRSALETPPDPAPGRVLARSFTWERAAAAHLDHYRSVLDR